MSIATINPKTTVIAKTKDEVISSKKEMKPSLRGGVKTSLRDEIKPSLRGGTTKQSAPCIPQLRFKEFEGDYVLSKLGSELNLYNGYAFSSKDSEKTGVRWVKIADVGINEMKLNSPSFLPINFKEKHSKFLLHKGDYVVALTRPILRGELKIAKIDTNFDGSLLNQRVGKLESKNDLEYMYCMLQQKSLISRIENRIAGTDPPNLSPNEIATLKTFIPSLPEQQKIASFLTAVDKKIQQLSKKKALLEQYKKGVMQQLFSQKIRFTPSIADFEEERAKGLVIDIAANYPDWEEKRLGELSSLLKDGTHGSHKDCPGSDYYLLSAKNIKKGKINIDATDRRISESEYQGIYKNYNLKENDVLLTVVGTIGRIAKFGKEANIAFQRSVAFFRFENDNPDYIIQFMLGEIFQRELDKRKVISAQPGVYLGDLAKIPIQRPSLPEQKKIAAYLSSIDTKIEAVHNEIIQTQTFKKGLLQQMFV